MRAGIAAPIALVMSLGSGQAMANGNELLQACQSAVRYIDSDGKDGDAYKAGYCFGVINGVSSLQGLTNQSLPKQARTCLPAQEVSVLQAARIAVKFMTANPEKLNLDDGAVVLLALQRAYPCP